MIERAVLAVLSAGALAGVAGAKAEPDAFQVLSGLYGNVRLSPETGDLGGFEVRFFRHDAQLMAEYVLCEGWCNEAYQSRVEKDGDGFVFANDETLVSSDGPTEVHRQSFRVTRKGKKLKLDIWYDGQPVEWAKPIVLKPLRAEFGLGVARTNG